jgi:hypothetical protein
MSQSDDQGRPGAGPYGQEPPAGQPYGQPQPGQEQYGQQPYGQPQQYGQPPVPPTDWAQQPHGAASYEEQYGQQAGYPQQYGQQQYGQPYGQYGGSAVPARPGGVTTAAVFGFVLGAIGVLATLVLLFLGAVAGGAAGGTDEAIPGLGSFAGAIGGVLIVFGVLALAWTVVMIWGAVRALSGRSRVLLLVGGSIAIVMTGFSFLGSLGADTSTAGDVIVSLILFAMSIAIVVLLAMKPAATFYAAHRARRGA